MADEIFIEEKCRWLSGIVQQCRQPERLLGRNAVHNGQRVCPDIARMMRIILPEALTGGKLRDELEQHIGEFLQQRSSLPAAQNTAKLLVQALRRNGAQPDPGSMDGGSRLSVDAEGQPRRKAQCAQHPQGVFRKALRRIADAADHAAAQVVLPAEEVRHGARCVGRHGVDRKIAARQIRCQLAQKVDPVRMAAIGIAGLGAERCDLVGHAPAHDRDRAVARARQDGAVRGKAGLRLLRRGARADIPVLRRAAEQAVAHAATDRIGRKTRRVQLPEQCLNLRRDRDAGRHFVSRRGSLQYGQSSIFPRLAGSTRWQCGQR